MALEWIPMRCDLAGDPAVVYIARQTKLDADAVVGKLHRFWSWVGAHTADGRLPGVHAEFIDDLLRKRGFAAAMASIPEHPWLVIGDDGVEIPNFDRWLCSSSKSRMANTKRQQIARHSRDNCATTVARKARPDETTLHLIAPTQAVDWGEARSRALEVSKLCGKCTAERDRRLVLGACALEQTVELENGWLEIALRETKAATPDKPYAFLQTVLTDLAAGLGVDFRGSLSRLDIPQKLLEAPKPVAARPEVLA
jgi:hypothetical protein